MGREQYTTCMIPHMQGSGKTKEQRQRDMCLGAKLCSGQASNKDEAAKLCDEAAANPKAPQVKRSRKSAIDTNTLATCVIKTLDGTEINPTNLAPILAVCIGQKADKPPSRERFIKKCFKENVITGDIREAQKLRSLCTAKWKEQEVTA